MTAKTQFNRKARKVGAMFAKCLVVNKMISVPRENT